MVRYSKIVGRAAAGMVTSHEFAIFLITFRSTPFIPALTIPIPTTAPTRVCVVLTGRPCFDRCHVYMHRIL